MAKTDDRALFEQGLAAGRKRDYARAVEIFLQLSTDNDPAPLFYLGRSLHGLGDYARAVQVLESLIRQFGGTSEYHFFLGRSLLSLGLAHKAVSHFEKARHLGGTSPQLLGLLGTAYLKSKNATKAVEVLAQAVEAAPEHRGAFVAYLNALMVRAIALFHEGDHDLCRQMLQFLLDNGVDTATIRRYLAAAYRETGHPELSIPHLLRAREEAPDDPVLIFQTVEALFHLGETERARLELQKVRHLLPEGIDTISSKLLEDLLPYQYFQQKKYRKAIFFALKSLQAHPNDASISLVLGESYRQLGELEKAQAHFERALKSNPAVSEPRYGLMMVFWAKGNFEQAYKQSQWLSKHAPQDQTIAYFDTLLQCKLGYPPEETVERLRALIRTSDPDPYLFSALAEQYSVLELDDLAVGWIQRALTLDPNQKTAMDLLSTILVSSSPSGWKKIFVQYLDNRPSDDDVRKAFIHKLLEVKDYKAAQKQLTVWIARGHRNESSLKALAFVYRMQGLFAPAFLIYRDLLHQSPHEEEYISSIVLCLFKTGRKELAIEFAQKALLHGKPSAKLHHQMGTIALAAEEWDLAKRSFNKALELNPNAWTSVEKLAELYEREGNVTMAKRYTLHAKRMKDRLEAKK